MSRVKSESNFYSSYSRPDGKSDHVLYDDAKRRQEALNAKRDYYKK